MITLRELEDVCYSVFIYFKESEDDKEWTKYDPNKHWREQGYKYVEDIQLFDEIKGLCVYLGRSSIIDDD